MIIKFSEIPLEGRKYSGEEKSSILELEENDDLRINGPVRYDLDAQTALNELIVRGKVSIAMTFRCSRCGESFSTDIKDPSFMCVKESGADQSVDLTEEIREAIILAFPTYPICRPDCRGLCVQCGVSLNKEKCGCSGKKNNAFSVLDNLKLK